MTKPARAAAAMAVLALVAALGACGPRIPQMPTDITGASTVESTPADVTSTPVEGQSWPSSPASDTVTVYLVKGGYSAPVKRAAKQGVPKPEAALRALLEGVAPSDRGAGYDTAIPDGVRLIDLRITDGVAYVDFDEGFTTIALTKGAAIRVTQVVYTLTEFPQIRRIAFLTKGKPAGSVGGVFPLNRPLGRSDVATFAPEP